jgi:hypothetical protein
MNVTTQSSAEGYQGFFHKDMVTMRHVNAQEGHTGRYHGASAL